MSTLHASPGRVSGFALRLVAFVDSASTLVGRLSSWLILVLTLLISVEVVSRYVFGWPIDWVFDTSYMLYGAVLLLAGAYALAKDAHVRADLLYGTLRPRVQAAFDLVLYLLFFMPGVLALLIAGYGFAAESVAIRESSSLTPDGPPIYPLKMVMPLAGALLLAQGLIEIVRCVLCLATGAWAPRAPDFNPVDIDKLRAEVSAPSPDPRRTA
ncbi:MAG: TRAP transporter small permease subunit [Aquisalimonadaceae bacterium]